MSMARASRLERETGGAHFIVDQAGQIALGIGVARQRRGILGAFADDAQRRIAAQIAGLDHHAAFARRQRQHGLDRRRDVAAAGLRPDRAPAAEQRDGLRLFDQPRRIGGQLLGFQPHQRKRIVHVIDRRLDQRVDALADQARVGTENEHDRSRRIGPREELHRRLQF